VQFLSLTADGGAAAGTTALTLTFSQAVPGLSAADITLESGGTGIQKDALSKGVALADGVAYTLSVSGVDRLGDVVVSVSKAGYSFGKGRQAVTVYPAPTKATFVSLTDNGVEATTAALTLVFDTVIEGLSTEDITLTDDGGTGASKGELSPTLVPNAYRLTVNGITKSGDVTVKVHKAGYAFSPDTLTAKARAPTVAVQFLSLAANGGAAAGTTALTLKFDTAIAGLSAEDITLTDDGYTGIRAGALTAAGTGAGGAVYTLAVSGTTRNGFVSVKIAKAGYAFSPEDTRSVQVYLTPIVKAAFLSLAANGGETAGTTALTLKFDTAIAGLSAEDITLTDDDGTDIRAGALTAAGAVYTLAVSGITKNGDVTVKVHKAGYAFSPDTQSAQVHPAQIWFESFTADGSAEKGTLELTLTFSRAVSGLTADDITLSDTDGTGIQKGALTRAGTSGTVYTLAVSGITKNGSVSAKVAERAAKSIHSR
jgi:hypothetical protein